MEISVFQKADIIAAPLTITHTREQVVDFTKPYMNLGITMLYRKPRAESVMHLGVIFLPFSVEVWIVLIVVFLWVRF